MIYLAPSYDAPTNSTTFKKIEFPDMLQQLLHAPDSVCDDALLNAPIGKEFTVKELLTLIKSKLLLLDRRWPDLNQAAQESL